MVHNGYFREEVLRLFSRRKIIGDPACDTIRKTRIHRGFVIKHEVTLDAVHEAVLTHLKTKVDGRDPLVAVIYPVWRKKEDVLHLLKTRKTRGDIFFKTRYLIAPAVSKEKEKHLLVENVKNAVVRDGSCADRDYHVKG